MADTILLLSLILTFITFLLFAVIKRVKLTKTNNLLFLAFCFIAILTLFFYTGTHKIKSDISRFIQNSSPKKAEEVYTLLFKRPNDSCLTVSNFKDQVIPKIDCCIWMEVKICPSELIRILNRKKYTEKIFNKSDSLEFLNSFNDRPSWWTPQILVNNITKANIKFDQDNEQTLFFGKDSSHVYLCDQAL
jgi:hypothetical protein